MTAAPAERHSSRRLHLPRPVHRPRPHVRQDDGHARADVSAGRAAAGPLAQPRPRLAVRRRTAGPRARRSSTSRRPHLKTADDRGRRRSGDARLRPAARRQGQDRAATAQGADPGHAQRREPGVAQTHLAFIRFHNRVVDSCRLGAAGQQFTTRARARAKHYQWMIRHGLPAADLRRASSTTCSPTGARCSRSAPPRPTSRPCRSSSRSPPTGSATA